MLNRKRIMARNINEIIQTDHPDGVTRLKSARPCFIGGELLAGRARLKRKASDLENVHFF